MAVVYVAVDKFDADPSRSSIIEITLLKIVPMCTSSILSPQISLRSSTISGLSRVSAPTHRLFWISCSEIQVESPVDRTAAGGGDGPEAVTAGMAASMTELEWRKEAAKMVVLIADAPPHGKYSQPCYHYDGSSFRGKC